MNNNLELEKLIIQNLSVLEPSYIKLIDESYKHINHAGVRESGGRHYILNISSPKLSVLTRIQQHQKIYSLLSDLFNNQNKELKIHALSMHIL